MSNSLLVHQFGHHFAGLGDEYYRPESADNVESGLSQPWSRT